MPFIDLHAHYPMHLGLPQPEPTDLTDIVQAVEFTAANLFFNNQWGKFRVTPETIRAGHLDAFGSVLYNPADEFFQSTEPLPDAFAHTILQLDEVETDLAAANIKIARNPAELEKAIDGGEQVAFHCLEGALAFGGDPGNVSKLAKRGIAYVIVAHLFYRGVATCNNAIPRLPDVLFRLINQQPTDTGLKPLGTAIVQELLDAGVLVDLTHSSDAAIADILRVHQSKPSYRDLPLISSHNSVRRCADYPLNLSDDTVLAIHRSGGVIGVIFFPYWLSKDQTRHHLDLVFDVIDCVYSITGSYDSIALGTDLDGFIQPVDELQDFTTLPAVEDAFAKRYPITTVDQVMYKNALRVFENGWQGA